MRERWDLLQELFEETADLTDAERARLLQRRFEGRGEGRCATAARGRRAAACAGTSGRHAPERADGMRRNERTGLRCAPRPAGERRAPESPPNLPFGRAQPRFWRVGCA
jgi:hypothetical protein